MPINGKVILDASAVIALINQEVGWEIVNQVINDSIMSAINVSEVTKFLIDNKKYDLNHVKSLIEHLIEKILVFDEKQAYVTADLYKHTKELGLSLGDRACIALAITTGYTVYTADKMWAKIKIKGAHIKLIR